ncbi:MAG TPA: DUF3152 domain-containing protein [Candidatus Saccharimonadales bacterium]|nr:DUF3152 domain-containing protein [Candidatus Saccharimonadales bacterium]
MKKRVRRTTSHAHRSRKLFTRRYAVFAAAVVVGLFVLANLTMLVMYSGKALPGYSVGDLPIGGKSYTDVSAALEAHSLPDRITVVKDRANQQMVVSDLGVSIDDAKTMANIKRKPLLPILSLVRKHTVPLVLAANQNTVSKQLDQFASFFTKPATDRHIAFTGKQFGVVDAAGGYNFEDSKTAQAIITALAKGKTSVTAITTPTPAGSNSGNFDTEIAVLNKQLQSKITFALQSQTIQPTAAEMASWYAPDGQTVKLSDGQIGTYLDTIATRASSSMSNRSDLILAIKYTLGKNLSNNFRVSPVGAALRTYCTAARGVSTAGLDDLTGKLAATYADTRGWNDAGAVAFKHVDSGCQYTVWLAAPAQMTSFGAICDNYYNCQVGTNVVVNDDRWLYATDPWNKTGQNLETYRLLIINHETGHRLGFRDNDVCPGPGQPAYVMMQQSIDLKGCVFNVWPTATELTALKSML